MKTICFVSLSNLHSVPYIQDYLIAVKNAGMNSHILFWDRIGINNTQNIYSHFDNITYSPILDIISPDCSKPAKAMHYKKIIKIIGNILKEKNFECVVFLQSHGAVLCYFTIMKYYKEKIIIDIRDYFLEKNPFFFFLEKKILEHSLLRIISSPAYKKFLPKKQNYVLAHNFHQFPQKQISRIKDRNRTKVIRISFIGTIRFFEIDKKFLNVFANDERFQINYYGVNSELLLNYCKINRITNVDFFGVFSGSQIYDFYENTDIINNIYGNDTPSLDFALSNKLYHSIQFELPILVYKNTFMQQIVEQHDIGFSIDLSEEDISNKVYNYYNSIDWEQFSQGCNELLRIVEEENNIYYNQLHNVFQEIKAHS